MTPHQIAKAALLSPLYSLLSETQLQLAGGLTSALGRPILMKREDQHPIFSFKARGACHKMLQMSEAKRAKGVVAASAGNHAQGVSFAAAAVGVPSYIFMPRTTPQIKIDSVKSRGSKVYLDHDNFAETLANAKKFSREKKLPFFHPFDDEDIITGQATVGLELLRQIDTDVEAIFVCCGGGGLLAGIATIIKQYRPEIKVIGVEPDDAATMTRSLEAGKLITLPYVGNFVETAAVARAGNHTFALCKKYVDDMIVVDSGKICNAIKEIYEDTRIIVEPAGALGIAGIREYCGNSKSSKALIGVISGANMNFDTLRYIVERTQTGRTGEMLLAAEIPEKPGSFLRLCRLLGKRHVTEFNYRFAKDATAHIFAGIELKDEGERKQILANLKDAKINAYDLSGDETAELHIRHMVGGRSNYGEPEQIYRLEFPERAGALVHFLSALPNDWNISLFHYRFHGATVGRALIGFQLSDSKVGALEKILRKVGYPYWRVNDEVSYEMFLADPSKN